MKGVLVFVVIVVLDKTQAEKFETDCDTFGVGCRAGPNYVAEGPYNHLSIELTVRRMAQIAQIFDGSRLDQLGGNFMTCHCEVAESPYRLLRGVRLVPFEDVAHFDVCLVEDEGLALRFAPAGQVRDDPRRFQLELGEVISGHVLNQSGDKFIVDDGLHEFETVIADDHFPEVDEGEVPVEDILGPEAFDYFLKSDMLYRLLHDPTQIETYSLI